MEIQMDNGTYDPERDERLRTAFVEQYRTQAYGCFSSGHKFCREICPTYRASRNESHTAAAFHANVVALDRNLVSIADIADDYTHCTQCGACELRCPNTLFGGDFYRNRTRTVALVKAVRALAVEAGVEQPAWARWNQLTDEGVAEPVLGNYPLKQEHVRDWTHGLPFEIPIGGETILFCDCECAFYRTSVPRAFASILHAAGIKFGLMSNQRCCGGPANEMGYRDLALKLAQSNVQNWRELGAKRILVLDPHDYISFTEDYPSYFGVEYDFEIVLGVELIAELIRTDRIALAKPLPGVATYHDACRLNKRKGIHREPREIIRAIPGLEFRDHDHVTQWAWCSGGGAGFPIVHPQDAAKIAQERIANAADLEPNILISGCAWSERPLTAAAAAQAHGKQMVVRDLFEMVAESMGLGEFQAPTYTQIGVGGE